MGLTGVYQNDLYEITAQYFLGNLHIDGDTEQSGFSTKLIYKPNAFSRLGEALYYLALSLERYHDGAIHGEVGFGHGTSITFEAGKCGIKH